MRNNYDNVAKFLGKGIPSAIDADEYDFHELVRLARLAKASETELTVSPGPKTLPDSIDEIAREGKGFIRIDWRR